MKQPALVILSLLLLVPMARGDESIEKTSQTGPVKATITLSPAKPVIGDTLTLTLRVVAEQNIELLMPEFGQMLDRFTILDFASTEKLDDKGNTVAQQRYELQPARSGRQSIGSIMIEFVDHRAGSKPAPDDMDAYELLTERLAFEVQSVLPDDADAQLNPPLGDLPPLPIASQSSRWWIIAAVAVLIIAAPLLVRVWLASRQRARQRSAYDIAAERLRRLLGWPRNEPAEIDRFFVELSAIVRRYVEDKFLLRAPELTTEQFMAQMSQSPDMSHDHQSLLRDFLRQADLVKFAHVLPSEGDMDGSVTIAKRFLDETHRRLETAHG